MSRWKRAWRAARIVVLLTASGLVLVIGASWWRSLGWSDCVLYRAPLRSVRDFDATLNERTPTVCRGEWRIWHYDGAVFVRREPYITDIATRLIRPMWEVSSEPIIPALPKPPNMMALSTGPSPIGFPWNTPPANTISGFSRLPAPPPFATPKTWWELAGFAATRTPDTYLDRLSLQVPHWAIMVLPLLIVIGFGAGWVRGLRRRYTGQCGRCGYDLRGLPIGTVCPECGTGSTVSRKLEVAGEGSPPLPDPSPKTTEQER